MQIINTVNVKGHVKIESVKPNGSREILYDDHNVLTNGFAENISQLLAGQVGTFVGATLREVQTGTARWASFMKVGSGSTAPIPSDTDLETPFVSGSSDLTLFLSSVSTGSPSLGSAVFSAILPSGVTGDDYNNTAPSEVGLFSENGVLLARVVYTPINKTPLFQLQYTWTITFRS